MTIVVAVVGLGVQKKGFHCFSAKKEVENAEFPFFSRKTHFTYTSLAFSRDDFV